MYKDFVPPVSIEEFAAYLDGNLTESGMEHVSSVISNSEYLGDIAEVSCSINDAIEQDLQEGGMLPSELSNMDFEIPIFLVSFQKIYHSLKKMSLLKKMKYMIVN